MRANDGDDDRARRQLSPEETRRRVDASLRRRYRSEQLFRLYGLGSVCLGVVFLLVLFGTIIGSGYSAFRQGFVRLDVHFDADLIDPDGGRDLDVLSAADYSLLVKAALRELVPEVASRAEKRELNGLVSSGAVFELRDTVMADAQILGQTRSLWLPLSGDVDLWIKARSAGKSGEDMGGKLSANQRAWLERLQADDRIELRFNRTFFTSGDSREPELAGIWGATKGSFFMLLVTLLLSFPLGVAAAIYLEEFARRSWWVDIVEVNINNLAAVPSIVFGLLGLAVFINFFGLPRSAPLVGGLVLTLMTLPVVIIASRAAIKAVPPSVREAALGIGASQMQMVFHHVLPLALPGMLTGAIIGMARALGESAPLLMIGMVAFIVDVPGGPMSPSTALPVQIYLWADSPERAFVARTSAAIMVLLAFLLVMNASAVWLRSRFERRW
ncbi:MAG: phosphate transport system permease protein [Pseudomonadota bacterium]|jgi:phosphate transport system permease protein|nr:phosphate transport system permease protein [Pseudomonadota bacterium]